MFVPGITHTEPASHQMWVGVWQGHILVVNGDFFLSADPGISISIAGLSACAVHKVGQLNKADVYARYYRGNPEACLFEKGQTRRLIGLRSFLTSTDADTFQTLGAACQLGGWETDHQFCGRCGGATVLQTDDRCRYCEACNHRYYPRVSPCVIMLVTRGDECLLAVHERSVTQLHTALAGFVEPGETLEAAVHREVEEEVGLRVGQVRYLASQPWPFPGQLMVGFLADYESGDLALLDLEISSARWFHYADLPDMIPPAQTLSGQLIRAFVAERVSRERD